MIHSFLLLLFFLSLSVAAFTAEPPLSRYDIDVGLRICKTSGGRRDGPPQETHWVDVVLGSLTLSLLEDPLSTQQEEHYDPRGGA